jgi:C1A family cysteine protease
MRTVAIVLIALAIAAHAQSTVPTWAYDTFDHWMQKFDVTYDSPAEKEYRVGIFYNNLQYIHQVNTAQADYTLGANQFADLTVDEFLESYTGFNTAVEKIPGQPQVELLQAETLPASVDWVTAGAVTGIKNQGQCGDCWAFSTVGSLEGLYFQSKGTLDSFSEQQLTDCSDAQGNMGCNGGLMDNAFKYVELYGIESETDYPFRGVDQKCQYDATKSVYKITGYTDVTPKSNLALQTASASQVVSIAIDAENIMMYTSGVFSDKNCGTQLDHGVTLVGYGTDATSSTPYWLVKNSWGTTWGEAGYIRFLRSTVDQETAICCLNCDASYPTLSQ